MALEDHNFDDESEWPQWEERKNEIWEQLKDEYKVPTDLLSELCELEHHLTKAEF